MGLLHLVTIYSPTDRTKQQIGFWKASCHIILFGDSYIVLTDLKIEKLFSFSSIV